MFIAKSVTWTLPRHVRKLHELLAECELCDPVSALQLLDYRFVDYHVRKYAISCLEPMPDEEVVSILLQLVQGLKFEPYLLSPLLLFLFRRAVESRRLIGHTLFWHLYSEVHHGQIALLNGVLLFALRRALPVFFAELRSQAHLVSQLTEVAKMVRNCARNRTGYARSLLAEIHISGTLSLPVNPRFGVCSLLVDKCKVMESFTTPLWLTFANADPYGDPIQVIYKIGDDLRQDYLTLQMIRIMDDMWKQEGLDLRMTPYMCMVTGEMSGMIEVLFLPHLNLN